MQAQYYNPFKVHILMDFPLQPFVRYNIDKKSETLIMIITFSNIREIYHVDIPALMTLSCICHFAN